MNINNRTILFRGKPYRDYKEWLYGSLIKLDNEEPTYAIIPEDSQAYAVDTESIGQFVTTQFVKQDNLNKDIYENDILHATYRNNPVMGKVKFDYIKNQFALFTAQENIPIPLNELTIEYILGNTYNSVQLNIGEE